MKTQRNNEKGFTLVEILLVIAMIGILASTIFVSLSGQRQRARLASAMETGRSVIPIAVDCFLMNRQMGGWTDTTDGGGVICAGNSATWPSLDGTRCVYENLDDATAANGNKRWRINCDTGTGYVSCFGKDGGNCCESNATYVCN